MPEETRKNRQKLHFRDDVTGESRLLTSIAKFRDKVRNYLRDMGSRHRREPVAINYAKKNIALLESERDFSTLDLNLIMRGAKDIDLGLELLKAAREGDAKRIAKLKDRNAPVNFRDPRTGATPLHYVAAYRARAAFRALTAGADCNFLIRDGKGRLAWELAVDADDAAMARLLVYKTRKQAEAQGVPFPSRRPTDQS